MFVSLQELPSRTEELMPPGTVTLSCVPYDIREYDPERRELHDGAVANAVAAGEPAPAIYQGSIEGNCKACGVRVGIGPRQQLAIRSAEQHEVGINVFCLLCGFLLAQITSGMAVVNLGNPEPR